MRNKKGDKFLSLYWFVIIIIVTIAIVVMVNIFYKSPYDIRNVEARILGDRIADCISKGGILKDFVEKNLNKDNLLEKCNLNFKDQEEDLFVMIDFYNLDSCKTENQKVCSEKWNLKSETISVGDLTWKNNCNLDKNQPTCVERWFYVLSSNKPDADKLIIKIYDGVKKVKENV